MTDCCSSNVARNCSFQIRVEDIVDDEQPPRRRDIPPSIIHIPGQSQVLVIQENRERPRSAAHLENVLKDLQTKMAAIFQEQIKNNMLFFQVNPEPDVNDLSPL